MPKTNSVGMWGLIKSSTILQVGIFLVLLAISFAIYNGANISLWGLEVNNKEEFDDSIPSEGSLPQP